MCIFKATLLLLVFLSLIHHAKKYLQVPILARRDDAHIRMNVI